MTMTADTFVRMLEEYRELVERVDRLREFLDRTQPGTPEQSECDDLGRQFCAMVDYRDVLLRRIERHAARFAIMGKIVVVDTWAESDR